MTASGHLVNPECHCAIWKDSAAMTQQGAGFGASMMHAGQPNIGREKSLFYGRAALIDRVGFVSMNACGPSQSSCWCCCSIQSRKKSAHGAHLLKWRRKETEVECCLKGDPKCKLQHWTWTRRHALTRCFVGLRSQLLASSRSSCSMRRVFVLCP